MTDIALLIGNTAVYWNQIIAVLGILAGAVLVFALCPYAVVKGKTVLLSVVLVTVISFLLSKGLYYYCNPGHFSGFGAAVAGLFDHHYNVMGLVAGTVLTAWIMKRMQWVQSIRILLDILFPGVILTLAVIRLGYYFTDTYHSTMIISGRFWQRLPFAVISTDTAGNISYVFAPFFISFVILLLTVGITVFLSRIKYRRAGELFYMIFIIFALSEMVLESTRYDSVKVHFMLLRFLNQYVGFISFSMLWCAVCILVIFLRKLRRNVKTGGLRSQIVPLVAFAVSFCGFGICEYLLQRYTTAAVVYHWLQTLLAVVIAGAVICVIRQSRPGGTSAQGRKRPAGNSRNRQRQKTAKDHRKQRFSAETD